MKCLFTVARNIHVNSRCVTARVGSSHETEVGAPVEHVEVHTSVVLRTNDNFKHISESCKTKASLHVSIDVPSMSAWRHKSTEVTLNSDGAMILKPMVKPSWPVFHSHDWFIRLECQQSIKVSFGVSLEICSVQQLVQQCSTVATANPIRGVQKGFIESDTLHQVYQMLNIILALWTKASIFIFNLQL